MDFIRIINKGLKLSFYYHYTQVKYTTIFISEKLNYKKYYELKLARVFLHVNFLK